MTGITRRQFGILGGATASALVMPAYARAQDKPKVVVVGGGANHEAPTRADVISLVDRFGEERRRRATLPRIRTAPSM